MTDDVWHELQDWAGVIEKPITAAARHTLKIRVPLLREMRAPHRPGPPYVTRN